MMMHREKFAEQIKKAFLTGNMKIKKFDILIQQKSKKASQQREFQKNFKLLKKILKQPLEEMKSDSYEKIAKSVGDAIAAAKTCAEYYKTWTGQTISEEWFDRLSKLEIINNKKEFFIVVTGLEKGGKSTFTNFLIGIDLLPCADERCTYVPTYVRNGEHLRVEVIHYTKDEFVVMAKRNVEATLFPPGKQIDHSLVDSEVKKLLENFPSTQSETITGSVIDIKSKLRTCIADKFKFYYIKEVHVYTPVFKFPVPVAILDIPGFDSVVPEHVKMAVSKIEESDAFVFVTNASQPSLTQPAKENLEVLHKTGGLAFAKKGFVLGTKLDRGTPGEAKKNMDSCKNELNRYGFERIFFGCVPADHGATYGTNNLDTQYAQKVVGCEKDLDKLVFLKGGVKKLSDALSLFMTQTLPLSRLDVFKDLMSQQISKFEILNSEFPSFVENEDENSAAERMKEKEFWDMWNQIWEETVKYMRLFRNENFVKNKKQILQMIAETFTSGFGDFFKEVENVKVSLVEDIPTSEITDGVANVTKIEIEKREKLFDLHHKNATKAAHKVGLLIHNKLREYVESVKEYLYPDLDFSLEDIYSLEAIQNQVESVVMRVAFPLATGVLLFCHGTNERKLAEEELTLALPELDQKDLHVVTQ